MFTLTQDLRSSYENCFSNCEPDSGIENNTNRIIQKIAGNENRYQTVADPMNIPWYVIAVIHNMEADLNFNCHLHNGDPLSSRTVHVPAGRPISGKPPFTWEESAADAIRLEGLDHWADWTISGICYKLEKYNGIGYRAHHINSPYLWGNSNQYTSGKYIRDGVFSADAVSRQIGAMVILKAMQEKGIIQIQTEDGAKAVSGMNQ